MLRQGCSSFPDCARDADLLSRKINEFFIDIRYIIELQRNRDNFGCPCCKDPRQARRPRGKQATTLRRRKMQTRVNRDSRVKGFSNVAEVKNRPLRRAVLKLRPVGKLPAIVTIVGPFFATEGKALSLPS